MTAEIGRTSKTELIDSHTSMPSTSPNFSRHSLDNHLNFMDSKQKKQLRFYLKNVKSCWTFRIS